MIYDLYHGILNDLMIYIYIYIILNIKECLRLWAIHKQAMGQIDLQAIFCQT